MILSKQHNGPDPDNGHFTPERPQTFFSGYQYVDVTKRSATAEIVQVVSHYAVQGCSRLMILVL